MIEVEAVQFSGSAMAEMQCNRRIFTAGMATLLLGMGFPNPARGQQLERSSLKLGVANKSHLYYLPVTIAERRGYLRDYGLAIAMSDFEGGGGIVRWPAQQLCRYRSRCVRAHITGESHGTRHPRRDRAWPVPGVVLAVGKNRPFKSYADLKGLKIGVTAPNSSSHFFVLYLMARAGLAPTDASFVGVGGGERAVNAMAAGEIDAISNLDPVITRLQQDGTVRVVADTRFPRVNYEIFGGTNPAAVLYAKQEFIAANPATMQALVNAFYKTLRWIATATTAEIVNSVPPDYFLGDRSIYVKALKANLLVYSRTGIMTRQGIDSAFKMMATFDPDLKGKQIELQTTFDDRFIKRATVLFDDPTNSDLETDERRPEIDLNRFQD